MFQGIVGVGAPSALLGQVWLLGKPSVQLEVKILGGISSRRSSDEAVSHPWWGWGAVRAAEVITAPRWGKGSCKPRVLMQQQKKEKMFGS